MARKARQRGFRSGFLGFGKKPKPVNGAKKPDVLNVRAHSENLRFALKQLSFQSKYFPELTAVHNAFLLKPEFYQSSRGKASSVPVIIGKISVDRKLALNMHRMRSLEEKINDLRNSTRRATELEHAKEIVDKARVLETEFNGLKEQNFVIFLEHFKKKKNQ